MLYAPDGMRERRRHKEKMPEEERKVPPGKDRTYLIYVSVPPKQDDKASGENVMEEFEFQLDESGKNYEYQFGHV